MGFDLEPLASLLLLAVEKAFAIRFHVGEVERVQNVGEFADLIAKRIQSR